MPSDEFAWIVRRDVAVAMAQTIVEKTFFDRSTYTEEIVPKNPPTAGFKARPAYWSYLLGIVEGRLDQKYRGFNVTEAFMKKSAGKPLRVTNDEITKIILANNNEMAGLSNVGGDSNDDN